MYVRACVCVCVRLRVCVRTYGVRVVYVRASVHVGSLGYLANTCISKG